jgi:hypothetical protein
MRKPPLTLKRPVVAQSTSPIDQNLAHEIDHSTSAMPTNLQRRVAPLRGVTHGPSRGRGLNLNIFNILNRAGSSGRQICRGRSHPKTSHTAPGAI